MMLCLARLPKLPYGSRQGFGCRTFFKAVSPFLNAISSEPKRFHAKKLFRHSPERVYGVVADVDRYREFVPYTTESRVLTRNGNTCRAQLTVGFPPVSEKYISVVTTEPNQRVQAESNDTSLFRRLRTVWAFKPGTHAGTCLVSFDVEFEFATGLHAVLAHQFFDDVSKQMVAAFEQRCDSLYGKP